MYMHNRMTRSESWYHWDCWRQPQWLLLMALLSTNFGVRGSTLDSSGDEFYIGFTKTFDVQELSLSVTTTETTPVNFIVTGIDFNFSGIATSNTSIKVVIPSSFHILSSTERNKGIYIKAEGGKKIRVYAFSYHEISSDAFLALPCSHLGLNEYEYYGISYVTTILPYVSLILIVACEDNTVVTTSSRTLILDRLQTYQIERVEDLTGFRVTTTKPISFIAAHECANVPVGFKFCDTLIEQIPPTAQWGSKFLVASLLGRMSGEIIRLVNAQNAHTFINFHCTNSTEPISYSLTGRSIWIEITLTVNSSCYIDSSSPILVMQFSLSGRVDNKAADPFMMMIPPIEQYSNNYVFDVPTTFSVNCITVYVAEEYFQLQAIFLDDSIIDSWVAVNCRIENVICGYISRVFLSSGEHRVYHKNLTGMIGVSAYGFNPSNSYGYLGGLNLESVQLSAVNNSSTEYKASTGVIVAVTVGVIVLVIVCVLVSTFFIFMCYKKCSGVYSKDMPSNNIPLRNSEKTTSTRINSITEPSGVDHKLPETPRITYEKVFSSILVPFTSLTVGDEIGQGAFGKVYCGELLKSELDSRKEKVAIKTIKHLNSQDELEAFFDESFIMKDFNHPNVLGLCGVCFDTPDEIPYILLPFMANGSLKDYLKKKRVHVTNVDTLPEDLKVSILVKMCIEIAQGMKYLASNKFVHRDLAARNCMVDTDLTIKIGDFGLARDIYSADYYRSDGKTKVPVKWMSPEALYDRISNEKTDIWSYGVTCWEVFSLGRTPYPGMENQGILKHITDGGKLDRPTLCPKLMYDMIMCKCWELKPEDRPSFDDLVQELLEYWEEHYAYV